MRTITVFVVAALLALMSAHAVSAANIAVAEMYNSKGEHVGMATFTDGHDGVKIAVNLYNMPPGTHALHIHAAGSCEKPDFKSAKGHFNPYEREHGLKNPKGPHAGDLMNIVVGQDGNCTVVAFAPLATLLAGKNSLLGEGGAALMIHGGPDDHVSDPAGDAGPRIACGVIRAINGYRIK